MSRTAASKASQDDVIAFLATPAAHGADCRRVDRIDTHISVVFLAGRRALKLKRAVHLPYVDYSSLERRRDCCEREVQLNRRTAPQLYRGVIPVTRSPHSTLAIDGDGTPVEWLVEMRRFEQDRLLDAVARRGGLDLRLAAAVGDAAARLHTVAASRRDHGGAAAMRWVVDENDAELSAAGAIVSQALRARIYDASSAALDGYGDLLDRRRDEGWVRECHGDLHLGNIFLDADRPVLFDCIEFNDDFSCIDVLYDVAFLVMDLLHRRMHAHANAALNAWLERLPQYGALPLLPLFLSCRAAIRAKVSLTAAAMSDDAARIAQLHGEAGAYLDRADGVMSAGNGAIVAIGGLSGSGKSTLAHRLAPRVGRPPFGIVLRSDVARKRRFGVEPTVRLPDSAYQPSVTAAVYEELMESARAIARAGYVAVVDAVFAREDFRQQMRAAAAREKVPFVGLWLDAPLATMEGRLAARLADASDATANVLHLQQAQVSAPADWEHVDATGDADRVAQAALERTRHVVVSAPVTRG